MKEFKTTFITKEQLPYVLEPVNRNITKEQFFDAVSHNQAYLKEKLKTIGGLLFRNFPTDHHSDFATVIRKLGIGDLMDYVGGDSPRTKVSDGIYTSTEAPPSIKIPLHNELSFVKYYPKYICFYCVIPSPTGGETILGNARKIYESVSPEIREKFKRHGLKYTSSYYHRSQLMEFINQLQRSHKSWIQVFETDSKEEVSRKCRENEFNLQWNQDDWLQISQVRPATMSHEETGEPVWFNQVHLFDFNPRLLGWWRYLGSKILYSRKHTRLHEVCFADGTPIPRQDIYSIMDVLDKNTIAFPWQKGDILILDNVLTMHGRATFSGKRRILTAMCG